MASMVEVRFFFHCRKVPLLFPDVRLLQTVLLICTVAKDIYEFLASDSFK